jgi:hypothetical protein
MQKITEFTRPQLQTLRQELNAKLTQLGDDLGIKISAENISYEPTECTIKLKASINGKLSRNQQRIQTEAKLIDIHNVKHGTQLHSQTRGALTVVDFKPRSPKYSWVVEMTNGNRLSMTDAGLKQLAKAGA